MEAPVLEASQEEKSYTSTGARGPRGGLSRELSRARERATVVILRAQP